MPSSEPVTKAAAFLSCAVKAALPVLAVFILALSTVTLTPSKAYACIGCCNSCVQGDCDAAVAAVKAHHATGEVEIMQHVSNEFTNHREWLTDTFFKDNILAALQLFTEQMSAVAMQQVQIIGAFFDAKHQLETQRLFQELQLQAHRDYQPSEDFCWFGTNVRSMAHSESFSRFTALALSQRQIARHLGTNNMSGAAKRDHDKENRWTQFADHYCDQHDNNWKSSVTDSGLTLACNRTPSPLKERMNSDIDYTRMIENRRTLDVDVTNTWSNTGDELGVMSLGNNLYGHNILTRDIDAESLKNKEYQHLYLALRAVQAKRSVAENSFNAIAGMRAVGTSAPWVGAVPPATGGNDSWKYLGAVLTELGIPEREVAEYLGDPAYGPEVYPSYYAQLEVLAKKIYQNPDFYANLYDKPANVARKSVALKAIDLMLDRAIYESQLRQEMAMSVLLSSRLRTQFKDAEADLKQQE
ncbi:MAG: hypothetical protein KDJ75_07600 [Alphaproteobacteria bacterium]|nr:hypothetical protein [Alphaproteobacteria bacterium]